MPVCHIKPFETGDFVCQFKKWEKQKIADCQNEKLFSIFDLSIGYHLISTCTGACDWLSRRQCTCCWIIVCSNLATYIVCDIFCKRNFFYRLPIKVYYTVILLNVALNTINLIFYLQRHIPTYLSIYIFTRIIDFIQFLLVIFLSWWVSNFHNQIYFT
jgi:hypothetical protein